MIGFNGEQEGDIDEADYDDGQIHNDADSSGKDPQVAFIDGDALDINDYDQLVDDNKNQLNNLNYFQNLQ